MNDIFDEDEPDMSEAIALNQQRIETFKMRQAELLSRADSDSLMNISFQDLRLERSASMASAPRYTGLKMQRGMSVPTNL
jgi:hypothetical protein